MDFDLLKGKRGITKTKISVTSISEKEERIKDHKRFREEFLKSIPPEFTLQCPKRVI